MTEKTFKDEILARYKGKSKDLDFYKGLTEKIGSSYDRHNGDAKTLFEKKTKEQGIDFKKNKDSLTDIVSGLFAEMESTTIHTTKYATYQGNKYDKKVKIKDSDDKKGLVKFVRDVAVDHFGWLPPSKDMDEIYTTILGAIGSDKEVNKILGILTGEKIDDELYQSVIAHLFETAGTLTRGQLHSGIRSRYQQLVDSKKIAPHEYGAALAAYAEHVSKGEVQVDAKDMTQPDQQYNAVMTASNDYIRKQLQIKSWQTHNYETKKAK